MKRLVVGILAHVDAGKTTLSEAMLYTVGHIGRRGRVDHGDAFLDTNIIEKERGITIFAKEARLVADNSEITLLDTPGHVDFSAEAERTLCVLDYAILVISGSEGVQSHTETLWKMLSYYNIPTFVFVNKMDLPSTDKDKLLQDMAERLDAGCVDFLGEPFYENVAMASDALLDEYIKTEAISDDSIRKAILERKVFPCFFGSALHVEGVDAFLQGLFTYTETQKYGDMFGAKVFKIAEDEKGQRLTFMKITGGHLKVKDVIGDEKVNEIRLYSGAKYKNEQTVYAGSICALPGLLKTYPGKGLGCEPSAKSLLSEPIFTYAVELPPEKDALEALAIFRKLAEEETTLRILWNEHVQKINVEVMGEIQLAVLKRILEDRFGLLVEFTKGSIIYKETIKDVVEGVGHYEPLRHYAEVHLLLESAKRGSGLTFASNCSEDILDKNWQRLIMTHLAEKTHVGVLTGAPITDMKITLINGRAHKKHTDGGDFRQATYRAVRQGLMQAESVLLEPYFSFVLEVPMESTGRAMTDLERMGATMHVPETKTYTTILRGEAPVSAIRDYHADVISYTHGQGKLNLFFAGYRECHNTEVVIEESGYSCGSDVENTPNSVFCAHGSGFTVPWDKVHQYMHIPALKKEYSTVEQTARVPQRTDVDEDELIRIYENTYGKITRKEAPTTKMIKAVSPSYKGTPQPTGPGYLLIDGYNIIYAWDDLRECARESLDNAREKLISRMVNYHAMQSSNIILVFDAYKVKGSVREIENIHGITVVYTKEAETADSYIEKVTHALGKKHRVKVATSDNLEQIIIFGHGARRVSASEFLGEVMAAEEEMRRKIEETNAKQ